MNPTLAANWDGIVARVTAAWRSLIAAILVFVVLAVTREISPWTAAWSVGIILLAVLVGPPRPDPEIVHGPAEARRRAPVDPVLFASLIESLPDPVILVDRQTRVVAFNLGAQAIAPALSRDEPVSMALRFPEIVQAVREVGPLQPARRVEFSERVPVDRWYAVHVRHIDIGHGDEEYRLLAFRDLTPLRRVEEMRADFVANASHELRTPLAALSGFIDTLLGPAREDVVARERFLGIMRQQARRMARLIDDLLSLSRIELNEHLPPEAVLDLVGVVSQVVDGLQMLARERDVEIVLAKPAAPLMIAGARDELARVYENLIENALKYGASGKRVDVGLRAVESSHGREAVVTVRDYGPGIPAEHVPRLTERFYRVDAGVSRAEGGTGLGLALVKHIVSRHRGRLLIDSELGKGATFSTAIPLTGLPAAESTTS